MNRMLLNALRFARRQSHGAAQAIRKAAAAGVSIAFALSPVTVGFFPCPAEAKARPDDQQGQLGSSSQCTLRSARGDSSARISLMSLHLTAKRLARSAYLGSSRSRWQLHSKAAS